MCDLCARAHATWRLVFSGRDVAPAGGGSAMSLWITRHRVVVRGRRALATVILSLLFAPPPPPSSPSYPLSIRRLTVKGRKEYVFEMFYRLCCVSFTDGNDTDMSCCCFVFVLLLWCFCFVVFYSPPPPPFFFPFFFFFFEEYFFFCVLSYFF